MAIIGQSCRIAVLPNVNWANYRLCSPISLMLSKSTRLYNIGQICATYAVMLRYDQQVIIYDIPASSPYWIIFRCIGLLTELTNWLIYMAQPHSIAHHMRPPAFFGLSPAFLLECHFMKIDKGPPAYALPHRISHRTKSLDIFSLAPIPYTHLNSSLSQCGISAYGVAYLQF
jgi:hypothetical protein